MKRFLAILLGFLMLLPVSACNGTNDGDSSQGGSYEESSENNPSGGGEASGKMLIAYFSGSGNTARVAGYIAEATGGTLFELVPVTPYTSADLSWTTAAESTASTKTKSSAILSL